jgi:exosome complex RNA-binding protein Csl4
VCCCLQLGYGDGDEATVVAGGAATVKPITTYFRKTFTIPAGASFVYAGVNILRDDGAVVYVNGVEAFRTNMPTGTVSWTTVASSAVGGADETTNFRRCS